jgi:hypothetical protein
MSRQVATTDPRADELHDIADCGPEAMRALAERIRASRTEMELVYRETEMDELWRWADVALVQASFRAQATPATHWKETRDELMRIHDTVGVDRDPARAAHALIALAQRLRATEAIPPQY